MENYLFDRKIIPKNRNKYKPYHIAYRRGDVYMSNKPDMEKIIKVLISLLEEQEKVEITYTIEKTA